MSENETKKPQLYRYGLKVDTTLSRWMKAAGVGERALAKTLRVNKIDVRNWSCGFKVPGVGTALRIEEVTNGEVPVKAWMEHPEAQSQYNGHKDWEKYQKKLNADRTRFRVARSRKGLPLQAKRATPEGKAMQKRYKEAYEQRKKAAKEAGEEHVTRPQQRLHEYRHRTWGLTAQEDVSDWA